MPHKDPEARKAYWRKYCREHPDKRRAWVTKYTRKLKQDVLTYYGNGTFSCVICGESRFPCLTIDHIDGKGAEHRRKEKYLLGSNFYRWLRDHNFPEGYQTLCMNCQWVKRYENGEVANGKNRRY